MTAEITVVIPSYKRETVLINTIASVLEVSPPGVRLLLMDQTDEHTPEVADALERFVAAKQIERVVLSEPSITQAMNRALLYADTPIILFLDDDLWLEPKLVSAHIEAHKSAAADLVVGRIIQPWQEEIDFSGSTDFHFATLNACYVNTFMGGNFSIKRKVALELGGFDENFVRVAYNFEAEFAFRYLRSGYRIFYEPAATVHHLKASSGGTRSFGQHLTTMRPDHSVGAYYFFVRTWDGWRSLVALVRRPLRAIATRHHLTRPWWIALTLIGEMRGLLWAIRLAWKGPALINRKPEEGDESAHE